MLALLADDGSDGRFALFVLIAAAVYLLPTVVALARGHRNRASIMVVNIMLGWTLLGWVISMTWAVAAAPQVGVHLQRVASRRRR